MRVGFHSVLLPMAIVAIFVGVLAGRHRLRRLGIVALVLCAGVAMFVGTKAANRGLPPFRFQPSASDTNGLPADPTSSLVQNSDESNIQDGADDIPEAPDRSEPPDAPEPPEPPEPPDAPEIPDPAAIAAKLGEACETEVHVQGQEIVIDLRKRLAATSQAATEVERRAADLELRASIRRDVAERLSSYFDDLADKLPHEPQLKKLGASLAKLSAEQRQRVAEQVARAQSLQERTTTTYDTSTGEKLRVVTVSVAPNQVLRLIHGDQKPPRAASSDQHTAGTVIGTICAILAAIVVLKAATRRHVGGRAA